MPGHRSSRESTALIDQIRQICVARRENIVVEGTLTWTGQGPQVFGELAAAVRCRGRLPDRCGGSIREAEFAVTAVAVYQLGCGCAGMPISAATCAMGRVRPHSTTRR